MVDDRITDGKRIAQLLSSELSGRGTPPLDRIAVVEADADAEPSPEGTVAYRVAVDADADTDADPDGDRQRLASVVMYPESVAVEFRPAWSPSVADRPDASLAESGDGSVLSIESGAAVKAAVDAVTAAVSD